MLASTTGRLIGDHFSPVSERCEAGTPPKTSNCDLGNQFADKIAADHNKNNNHSHLKYLPALPEGPGALYNNPVRAR
jgi:hypothetical protein